jgi:hypothetical protein
MKNPKRCVALKRLASLNSTGAAAYPGGGVIDYSVGSRTLSAVLIVDSDGLYHIAMLDPFRAEPSVGTKFSPRFDAAVEQAANALRSGDCQGYLRVAFKRFGVGTLSAKRLCPLPKKNLFAVISENAPSAKLRRLGGNGDYAFYSYGTPSVNYTLVAARESDEGLPSVMPNLPKGAAEYAYFGAYRTYSPNAPSRKPASSS